MKAVLDHLLAVGVSQAAFARQVGIDARLFQQILAGDAAIDYRLAQRIVDAAGGALTLDDLLGGAEAVVDLRRRAAVNDAELDAEALECILADILPALLGGANRKGDEHLPRLAADAAASAYAALSTVTTRRNADRLVQALLPVFAEILEEMSAPSARRAEADALARQAAERYLQTTRR
ncbi:MAG: hypothetical protein ACKVS5_08985 [Parvularculaceae bacterium]